MSTVLCIVGTRPDAIKMAPVILELKRQDDIQTIVYSTGQHREMLEQVLSAFNIAIDGDLAAMRHGQPLAPLTATMLSQLDEILTTTQPDVVVAQGDTTSTFVSSLAAFYRQIPFAHVEAGLRTDTIESPFPEEFNRRATGLITRLHFAPTQAAASNLLQERVDPANVFVTGNTSIDAVLTCPTTANPSDSEEPLLLVTTHRRENWGEPQVRICTAIKKILSAMPSTRVVLPMHRNPSVRQTLQGELSGIERIRLIEPPEYPEFVSLMRSSTLILTDSGGVQEEAPALGKPVLVLRAETERPEGITAGSAALVGTDVDTIVSRTLGLLNDPELYEQMAKARNPYGDGLASRRIVAQLRRFLGLPYTEIPPFDG